ncbi:hypothetical protein AQUCO_00201310v1 [Aquilegia coerulea]|uniref:14-3-3 domain-containing protein n=1 Tax=Aquilegia coerulea TaxID=218851 RepID=A0A2G5F7B4_AQUCA|nr:hypothetical protein AQUCO_00201310v1 [Aquilegia coerulea]
MDLEEMTEGLSREDNVYLAKLAKLAMRYEDMVGFMDKVVQTVKLEELNKEEKYLWFMGYKNVIRARATSWEIISSIERKEKCMGNAGHVKRINKYMRKIRPNIREICSKIMLNLKSVDFFLINSVLPDQFKENFVENQVEHVDNMNSKIETDVLKICDELLDIFQLHLTVEPLEGMSYEFMEHIFPNCFSRGGNIDYDIYLSELESGLEQVKISEMSREEGVYMAVLAQQAVRFNDMFDFMKGVVTEIKVDELTLEERRLWSLAYIEKVSTVGYTLGIVSSILDMEEDKQDKDRAIIIKKYMHKLLKEFYEIYALTLKHTNKAEPLEFSTQLSLKSYFQMHRVCLSYLHIIKPGLQTEEAS